MDQIVVLECVSKLLSLPRIGLVPGKAVVGRSRHASIYVPDPTVSRRHAELLVSATDVNVIDLGSRNGTFVQEMPIGSSPVLIGQYLRFGAVSFRLVTLGDVVPIDASDSETRETKPEPDNSNKGVVLADLTPAQRRVFNCLLEGLAEKNVASRLEISQHTVHNHIREIYRVLGVHSRSELLSRFLPRI